VAIRFEISRQLRSDWAPDIKSTKTIEIKEFVDMGELDSKTVDMAFSPIWSINQMLR
jgi:hypothetical protein